MTSGKATRKARQEGPSTTPRRTPTSGGGRQASPKVLAGIAGGVLVIVVAIVLGVVLAGGSSDSSALPETGSLDTNLSGANEVDDLFQGIPQSGTTLGKASAPATMTIFVDLQCPACREFETRSFPDIVEKYVRPGKLRVDLQAWAFIGPDSDRGRLATIAAGEQGKAFNYAALLYGNQGAENAGWLDDDLIGRVAAAIPGMKVQQLLSDRDTTKVKDAAKAVDTKATADGVNSTPTIFVGKTGAADPAQINLLSLDDPQPVYDAVEEILGNS